MSDTTTNLTERLESKLEQEPSAVAAVTIRDRLNSDGMKKAIARALPGSIDPDRFARICLNVLQANPDLQDSGEASFLGAVLTAASLGLEFGALQEVYLVPFKDHGWPETQLIIGYRGYVKLAYRSGLVKDIAVRPVYEGDEWDYWYDETGDHMLHRPTRASDRGDFRCFYSRVVYTNGGGNLHVMFPEDIEERKNRSATANSKRSPWKSDYLPMALKTVLRAQTPWLPLSSEVAEQLANDEQMIRLEGTSLRGQHVEVPEETLGDKLARERDEKIAAVLDGQNPAVKQRWSAELLDRFGPAANLDPEGREKVLDTVLAWQAHGDILPVEKPAEVPEAVDEVVVPTEQMVAQWTDTQVSAYAAERLGLSNGTPEVLRGIVTQDIVDRRNAGEQEAWDLF